MKQVKISNRKPTPNAESQSFSTDELRARIAQRAYELYEQRGRSEGGEVNDWLQAEREMLNGG